MPINAHPDYLNAEKEYHEANNSKDKLAALEKMIRYMPRHKSAENLRKNIRNRYKKLKSELAQSKKSRGSLIKPIKKEELQAVLVGLTNSGKSSILQSLTNARPKIASYGFTTTEPEIGTLNYKGCNIQIIDLPPVGSTNFNHGIINSADTLLIVIEKVSEIDDIIKVLRNKTSRQIVVFNKIDLYEEPLRRKISETLRSKKHNFVLVSAKNNTGLDDLKERLLKSFDIIRVYTRHPKRTEDNIPVILKPDSTLEDVAEKILHGYSKKVKYSRIWGPSSKFPGQQVGLKHAVKDQDIIEFFTE